MNEKLKEIFGFVVCIFVLLSIAYFTGFLKGFAPSDFQEAFGNLTNNMDSKAYSSRDKFSFLGTADNKKQTVKKYESYQPNIIPEAALRGSKNSNVWTQIFNSDKKVVFYTYKNSDSDLEFRDKVNSYLSSKEMRSNYILFDYSQKDFNLVRQGEVGPSKICDSFEECNKVRQKAADYSLLYEFMRRCGDTMCVINNEKHQYVRLKSKDAYDASIMLNTLLKW